MTPSKNIVEFLKNFSFKFILKHPVFQSNILLFISILKLTVTEQDIDGAILMKIDEFHKNSFFWNYLMNFSKTLQVWFIFKICTDGKRTYKRVVMKSLLMKCIHTYEFCWFPNIKKNLWINKNKFGTNCYIPKWPST